MEATIIRFPTQTRCDQAELNRLAEIMRAAQDELDTGIHEICMTLADQRIATVARAIIRFEQLFQTGIAREQATADAIAAARAGML